MTDHERLAEAEARIAELEADRQRGEVLLADLLALHVRPTQAEVLLDSVEWVRLAYAIVYVQQELHTGLVRSPAGLLVWWLKRFG